MKLTPEITYPNNTKLNLIVGGTLFAMKLTNPYNITLYRCVVKFTLGEIKTFTYQLGTLKSNQTVNFTIPKIDVSDYDVQFINHIEEYGFTA